jgi:hypothetical protein
MLLLLLVGGWWVQCMLQVLWALRCEAGPQAGKQHRR